MYGMSLPVWGEWIEIAIIMKELISVFRSLPVWGEWIEICRVQLVKRHGYCLSPCGESGLKSDVARSLTTVIVSLPVWGEWIEIPKSRDMIIHYKVSPRVGRVD